MTWKRRTIEALDWIPIAVFWMTGMLFGAEAKEWGQATIAFLAISSWFDARAAKRAEVELRGRVDRIEERSR
jgi:RecB family exonuclease